MVMMVFGHLMDIVYIGRTTNIDNVAIVKTYVDLLMEISIWRFRRERNGFEEVLFDYTSILLLLLFYLNTTHYS